MNKSKMLNALLFIAGFCCTKQKTNKLNGSSPALKRKSESKSVPTSSSGWCFGLFGRKDNSSSLKSKDYSKNEDQNGSVSVSRRNVSSDSSSLSQIGEGRIIVANARNTSSQSATPRSANPDESRSSKMSSNLRTDISDIEEERSCDLSLTTFQNI